jgi:SAM-dependent methyltransferase
VRSGPDSFDEQYARMGGDESNALDHPLYRYLLPYAKSRVDVACEMLGQRRFERVAEFGVGSGELVRRMVEQFRLYLGFDVSAYQLSLVPDAIRRHPRVVLARADLEQPLPCEAGAFDLVVSLSTIEYLRDPVFFIREVHRVLAPHGTLVLHTMNVAFLPRRLQLLCGRLPTFNAAHGWQGGILHEFTLPRLRRLLVEEGFAVEAVRCSGIAPRPRRWWATALAGDMVFECRRVERRSSLPAVEALGYGRRPCRRAKRPWSVVRGASSRAIW